MFENLILMSVPDREVLGQDFWTNGFTFCFRRWWAKEIMNRMRLN